MVSIEETCNRRKIRRHDFLTPLLVPSLSSKGFPQLAFLWESVEVFLPPAILISSYDLHYDLISPNFDDITLIFIDSGGYEARQDKDLSEIYDKTYFPREWTREQHLSSVVAIENPAAKVLISFDDVNSKNSLSFQVNHAREFFNNFPESASDFLIKPVDSEFIDFEDIKIDIGLLKGFDIIGVTEKEIGNSIVDRMGNIVRLRSSLSKMGLETPIHIFGCLDPLSVWLYFLCGADIFDGLSWLRFAYHQHQSIYRNNWAVMTNQVHLADDELSVASWFNNIEVLTDQQYRMSKYTASRDIDYIPFDQEYMKSLLLLVDVTFDL